MESKLVHNAFVVIRNKVVLRDLYVQKLTGNTYIAHGGSGVGNIFYDFALTYDDMVRKLVKGKQNKIRLIAIKEDFLEFLNNKKIGTKVYLRESNKTDEWLELVWNGEDFRCGRHLFYNIDDLLNFTFQFQKPNTTNITTDWTLKGHTWSDDAKSWIRINK